jgi:hypothetical protein
LIEQALRNVFGASFLAIAGLLLVLATLISIVSCVLPFWFKLTLRNQVFDDDRPPYDIYYYDELGQDTNTKLF